MDFFILDKILDRKLCHSCNKYLTVLPVKQYPNGRCTKDGDGGTISLYNLILARSIVRCMNKFDGCRELLIPSRVIEHEQKCKHRDYVCPLCTDQQMIPAFLFMPHFRSKHGESILDSPNFMIKNLQRKIERCLLYEFGDNLFLFIVKETNRYCLDYNDGSFDLKLTFNLSLLGDSNVANAFQGKIFVNCGISSTEIDISTSVELCTTISVQEYSVITIFFTIINPYFKNIYKMPINDIGLNEDFGKFPGLDSFSKGFEAKSLYFQKRNIFLNEKLYNSSLKPTIKENTYLSVTIGTERIDLILTCLNCSLVTSYGKYDRNYQPYNKVCFAKMPSGKYRMLCNECSLKKSIWNNFPTKIFIDIKDLRNISYYCIWKCGNTFSSDRLYCHELYCNRQQESRLCPINGCDFEFELNQFVHHFEQNHSSVPLQLSYKMSYISLTKSKYPINVTFLVSNVFIMVELLWKGSYWMITLKHQSDGVEPRALIYSSCMRYTWLIKRKGKIPDDIKNFICIHCYLVNPIKMFEIEKNCN